MAALLAGVIPNTNPTVAATLNEINMEVNVMMVGKSPNRETRLAKTIPRITPMIPPDTLIITASNKNWLTLPVALTDLTSVMPVKQANNYKQLKLFISQY